MTISVQYSLSPFPYLQFIDANGDPMAGFKLYTYAAGTSTLQASFSDASGTPNTNPVIADSAGRMVVYLDKVAYKFVGKDSNDVLVFTQDNIVDPSAAIAGDAVGTTDTQSLSNKTLDDTNQITVKDSQFTLENSTTPTKTGGFDLSGITASTRRNLKFPDIDGEIATAQMSRSFQRKQGTTTAAATSLVLPQDGDSFFISAGIGQINAIETANWQQGSVVTLIFTGAVLVKYNTAGSLGFAPILLQGATDFQAGSPDSLTLRYDGTVWQEDARAVHSTTTSGLVRSITVSIANAAIKTLPTTGVDLVAAPGVGRFHKFIQAVAVMDMSGGIYTNVNVAANLRVMTKTGLRVLSNDTDRTIFMNSADIYEITLSPRTDGIADLYSKRDNEALVLSADNQGDGNFTGGDTANTMTVFLTYLVEKSS